MLAAVLAARRAVNPARGRGDALFACAEPKVVHGRVEEDEDDALGNAEDDISLRA